MKITLSKIYTAVLLFVATSCTQNTSDNNFDLQKTKSIFAELKDTIVYFEGRLEKVEKIAPNQYYFYMKDINDSGHVFISSMFFSESDISMLKDSVINCYVSYKIFQNPVKRKEEKILQAITPIYNNSKITSP